MAALQAVWPQKSPCRSGAAHAPVARSLCRRRRGTAALVRAAEPGACADAPQQLTLPAPVWLSLSLLSDLCSKVRLPVRSSLTASLKMTPSSISSSPRLHVSPSFSVTLPPLGAGAEHPGEGWHCSDAGIRRVGPACLSVLTLPPRCGLGLSLPVLPYLRGGR